MVEKKSFPKKTKTASVKDNVMSDIMDNDIMSDIEDNDGRTRIS